MGQEEVRVGEEALCIGDRQMDQRRREGSCRARGEGLRRHQEGYGTVQEGQGVLCAVSLLVVLALQMRCGQDHCVRGHAWRSVRSTAAEATPDVYIGGVSSKK